MGHAQGGAYVRICWGAWDTDGFATERIVEMTLRLRW